MVLITRQITLNCLPVRQERESAFLDSERVIGETIGWKGHATELLKAPSTLLGVQFRTNDAMAVAK